MRYDASFMLPTTLRAAHLLAVGLLLAGPCVLPAAALAATTTHTSAWSGGTIAPGDTAVINDNASITGNVIADGTLQFNQTTALPMSSTISGSGGFTLTNTGTVTLTGLTSGTGVFDLSITAAAGQLTIGATGSNTMVVGSSGVGSLHVSGGSVRNGIGILGLNADGVGSATVSSGSWSNASGSSGRILYVGYLGTGSLNVVGGHVSNSNGYVGFTGDSLGSVTVSSGTWQNRGSLFVGGAVTGTGGAGTLTVTGGQVTYVTGYVGGNATAVGTAVITGGTLASTANLNVGSSGGGTGTLTISGSGGAGGVVIVGGTLVKGGAGTINLNAGGTLQIGTGSATGGLGTDLVNNGALVFSRTGSSTVSSAISGTGALTKQGTGTLTFSGTSSYSGATAINAGSFLVSGALGNSAVSVNAGGLLGGSGTISGSITAGASGTLSPGAGIESLATGAVTLLDQSTFAYEMNSAVPLAADLLSVTGNLSLSGTVGLTLTDLATSPSAFAAGTTFSLINYTGSWNSGLFSYGGSVLADGGMFSLAGQLWTIDYDATSGGLNFSGEYLPASSFVNIATVPEPSACALAAVGFGLAGLTRWRRRWAAKNTG